MYGNIGSHGQIKCRTCTGQQVIEMECIMCDTVKELDGFYKAQRRNPDQAVSFFIFLTFVYRVDP